MQKKSNIMERLDNLRALIQEPDFQEGKGLSNEVNIRIFCYDPKDEMAIRHFTEISPSWMISESLTASPSRKKKRENSLCWIR